MSINIEKGINKLNWDDDIIKIEEDSQFRILATKFVNKITQYVFSYFTKEVPTTVYKNNQVPVNTSINNSEITELDSRWTMS